MMEERSYPVSRKYLLNVVSDIIELQNAKNVVANTSKGQVGFSVRMYGFQHQFGFTISSEDGLCRVRLETDGDSQNDRNRLGQMFALLENLMNQSGESKDKRKEGGEINEAKNEKR